MILWWEGGGGDSSAGASINQVSDGGLSANNMICQKNGEEEPSVHHTVVAPLPARNNYAITDDFWSTINVQVFFRISQETRAHENPTKHRQSKRT